MKAKVRKHKYNENDFISKVNGIYDNKDHKSIAQQRQALIEVYSQGIADEAVFCDRYREIKYDVDHALSDRIGMCISGATSLFIAIAMLITQVYDPLCAIVRICVFGGVISAITALFIRWAKRLYMKNKVLFLYPLEMKLLEDKLFQDAAHDTYEITGTALPDDPDVTAEVTDSPHN